MAVDLYPMFKGRAHDRYKAGDAGGQAGSKWKEPAAERLGGTELPETRVENVMLEAGCQ